MTGHVMIAGPLQSGPNRENLRRKDAQKGHALLGRRSPAAATSMVLGSQRKIH